jgi:hypothetical protein
LERKSDFSKARTESQEGWEGPQAWGSRFRAPPPPAAGLACHPGPLPSDSGVSRGLRSAHRFLEFLKREELTRALLQHGCGLNVHLSI